MATSSTRLVLSAGFVFMVLLAACNPTPSAPPAETEDLPAEGGKTPVAEDDSPAADATSTPVEIPIPDGWLVYENLRHGYRFYYPPEAEIEEIGVQGYPVDEQGNPVDGLPEGMTLDGYFTYLEQTYGYNLCVGVRYSLGYLYFSAAENAGARFATCGRTGVGVAEIIPQSEIINLGGDQHEATGMEVKGEGESLDVHSETMVIWLPDGMRIEYGSVPRHDATYADYYAGTRDILLRILATFSYVE